MVAPWNQLGLLPSEITLFTPTQNFEMYLDQLTHQIENPHRYQNVRNKIFFHFRHKSSTHAISRLRKIKKTENKV